ncbi:MAG: IPT/TIG domain-containing protein [bacterium]
MKFFLYEESVRKIWGVIGAILLIAGVWGCDEITGDGGRIENAGITINGGDKFADYLDVTLALTADYANQMMIGNSADLSDGVWEDFSPTKSWILPASSAGEKATVYAKFRYWVEGDGFVQYLPESDIVSDDITINVLESFSVVAPSEVDVGVPFDITIKTVGTDGGAFKPYAGSVNLSTSSGGISPGAVTGFAKGVATVSVTLDTVAVSTITVIDASTGRSGVSGEIVVGPTSPPTFSSLSANWGIPGKSIAITGDNFGPLQRDGSVSFGTQAASVASWGNTSIVVTVPDGLALNSSVNVSVSARGQNIDAGSFYVGWKVSTLAGDVDNPVSGYQDGSGKVARFNSPKGVVVVENKLYVVDSGNKAIRSVNTSVDPAEVGTLVQDNTLLASPTGIALYGDYLYVTDGNAIRRVEISSGSIDTLPVSGVVLNNPRGITAKDGYLYVANTDGNNILKISVSDGAGENLVTLGAPSPYGITTDGVDLYVTRSSATEHRLDRITMSGGVTSIVTSGLEYPRDLVVGDGEIYVADTMNFVIRRVDVGVVETIGGGFDILGSADGFGVNARFNRPQGIAFGSGVLYVADTDNHIIREMEP